MRRDKKIDTNIIFLLLIIFIFAGTALYIFYQLKTDEITHRVQNSEEITVNINITDGETLLFSELLIYNTKTHKAAIFNIPGNYGSIINRISRIDRIDVLFDSRNPEEFVDKIEKITELEIPYYINIDIINVSKIVDLVSGLDIFIANPVENITSEKAVLLPSGSNVLDGDKINTFLTYSSDDENDTDLIGRWHKFLQSFLKKLGEESVFVTSKGVFPHFSDNIVTNLNNESLISFVRELKLLDSERIIFQRILGTKKIIDEEILLFPYYNGNLLKETLKQTIASIDNEDIISDEEINITIEIQNGTKVAGLANRTAYMLKNFGYDILSVKNADNSEYEKTKIISKNNEYVSAQKVAKLIRCKNIENMEPAENNELQIGEDNLDVILIIGKDFDGRYCK